MSEEYDGVLIDNYDSFTGNLRDLMGEPVNEDGKTYIPVDQRTELQLRQFYNDQITFDEIRNIDPDFIAVSPGPGNPANPEDVGATADIMDEGVKEYSILGVCMGMESMVYENGGEIGKAQEPLHGKTSEIIHDEKGIFDGLEQGFEAGRYHSLVVDEVGPEFEVSAYAIDETDDEKEKVPMAVRHKENPLVIGVQFHPESVLTPRGDEMIQNYYEMLAHDRDI